MLRRLSVIWTIVLVLIACSASILIAAAKPASDSRLPNTGATCKPVNQQSSGPAPGADFVAQLQSREKHGSSRDEPPAYITWLAFISKLALVVGLAYVTVLGLRRLTAAKGGIAGEARAMKVLESLPIGANRTLHLVEAGSRTLLIASTPSQISLITEFRTGEIEVEHAQAPLTGFGEQLKAFLGIKVQSFDAARNVAQVLRDSSEYLRKKAADIGRLRTRHGSKIHTF